MKKLYIKKFLLIFISTLVTMGAIFFACKKIDEFNNQSKGPSKLLQYYDSNLVESFKKESLAKEFLQEVQKISIKIEKGMLNFNSIEDYNKVYDLIVSYTNRYDELLEKDANFSKYRNWEQMPEDIMAFLFESQLGFNSLRAVIEEQLVKLERGQGISDDNDPDNHHIVSPFQRSLLTPDCEIIVNDLICVFYDTYSIGIMNKDWKTLKELHEIQKKNNFDEVKALEFCSGNPEAFFLTTKKEPSLHVDFTYMTDEKNHNTIQFYNYSCSEAYKDMEYLWDFGDGTTSTERNPKHTFDTNAKAGTIVCLTVNQNGGGSREPSVDCQPIPFPPPPPLSVVNFTYLEGNNGYVAFTCTSPEANLIARYTWDFGDKSAIIDAYNPNTNHTYSKNGNYNVKLTVHYINSGGTDEVTKSVEVKKQGQAGNCCVSGDREVDKEGCLYSYDGENRRVKEVIRINNSWLNHRIVTKTKHQRKTTINTWVAKNAEVINVGYEGYIYWESTQCTGCGCEAYIYLWNTDKTNYNQRVLDVPLSGAFTVTRKSLWAKHYVKADGIVRIDGIGDAAVHDDSCSNN